MPLISQKTKVYIYIEEKKESEFCMNLKKTELYVKISWKRNDFKRTWYWRSHWALELQLAAVRETEAVKPELDLGQ